MLFKHHSSSRFRLDLNLRDITLIILALGVILILWLQNFGRIYLYDYSLVAYANAYLQRGMRPYRDFGTPLQTLTYYLGYISEIIFGRRYLALAYSNLVATYLLFGSTFVLAKQLLSCAGAVVIALSICIATTLQNGIIWYNALGILLLIWVALCWWDVVRRQKITVFHLVAFAILFVFTGTLKLNYHAANAAIFGFCLLCLVAKKALSWPRLALISVAAALWAIAAPVCWELLLTGVSFSTWKLNVLVRASGRRHDLILLRSRNFWLGTVRNFYPGDPFAAIFAVGLVCCVAITLFLIYHEYLRVTDRKCSLAIVSIAGVWMFFGLSTFLAVTNIDLESTAASLLPIGLIVVCVTSDLGPASKRVLNVFALAFALWLGYRGLYGIHRHSRLLIPSEILSYQVTYPVKEGYLKGASLTELNAEQLTDAERIVKRSKTTADSSEIYWGPGTEIFCRQFNTTPLQGFPLWYSPVSARKKDVPEILARLQRSPIRIFVVDPFWYRIFVPIEMKRWLTTHWKLTYEGSLIVFERPRPS